MAIPSVPSHIFKVSPATSIRAFQIPKEDQFFGLTPGGFSGPAGLRGVVSGSSVILPVSLSFPRFDFADYGAAAFPARS